MKSVSLKRPVLTAEDYPIAEPRFVGIYQKLLIRWREPLMIFAGWRILLLLVPFLAAMVLDSSRRTATSPFIIGNYYTGTLDFWTDRFLAAWGRWDGEWYLQIVNYGYTPPNAAPAFLPLYPLLVKLVGLVFWNNYMLAGVLVSSICSLLVFVLLYNLTGRDFKGKGVARLTLISFSIFPTVFFLAAIYTEALFMALSIAAFFCARHLRNTQLKWWVVGLLAALAALTRNVGILLVLPLVWEWWEQNHRPGYLFKFNPGRLGGLVGLISLPILALVSWLDATWFVLGDPLLFMKSQSSWYWSRGSAMPWQTSWNNFVSLFSLATFSESNLINFASLVIWAVLFGAGCWLVYRKRYPVSYMIFMFVAFIPGMCAPRADQPLFALPRYLLVLFPAYQIIALILPQSRWLKIGLGLVSCAGLLYLATHFVQWGWVA